MASNESEVSRLERADALGLAFVRTVILLNGGAILAILTFIGNAQTNQAIQFDICSIKFAMSSFLIGIALTLLGLIVSYSYTATAPEYAWHQFWDKHIILLNSLIAVVCILAFVFGVASLIRGSLVPT